MKIVDKFLNVLKDVQETVAKEEQIGVISKIVNNNTHLSIQLEDYFMVNDATGDHVIDEIKEIVAYFSFKDDEYLSEKIFFRDFFRISTYLNKDFGLSSKEIYQLLALLIKRNYDISSQTNARTIIDHDALRKIKFKNITGDEVSDIFKDPERLKELYLTKNLSEKDQAIKEEIDKHLDEFAADYTDFCKSNDAFYLGFVVKFPNISLEDIVNGIKCLKNLAVTDKVISYLTDYFIGIFESNLNNSNIVFDISLNDTYIKELIDDEDRFKKIHDEIVNHNALVARRVEKEKESFERSHQAEEEIETVKYLTEKDVRELKKYVRKFFDMYHVEIVSLPSYFEFIQCIDKLEVLEEDFYAIARIVSLFVTSALSVDNYLSSYDELINIVSYFIKYKVERVKVDMFIRKYKHLKEKNNDVVIYLKDSLDEIKMYDESLADDIKDLLYNVSIDNKEDYEALISILEECKKSFEMYSLKTDYEYNEALKKLGR